jgi:hypothetical protein
MVEIAELHRFGLIGDGAQMGCDGLAQQREILGREDGAGTGWLGGLGRLGERLGGHLIISVLAIRIEIAS